MDNKYKILAKNTLIFTLGSVGSKIISFLLVPFYTHYLTKGEYGIADLVFTFAQILVPVLSLMITSGIFRFGLSKQYRREDVLVAGLVSVIPGILLMPLISLALKQYTDISEWVWYLCAYVESQMLYSIGMAYLKVKDKNKAYASISVFQTFLIALFNIILIAKLSLGVRGYLLSSVVASVIACSLTFMLGGIFTDIKKSKYDVNIVKILLIYSSPLIANELSWWVIHSCDKLMIQRMLGDEALGLYSIAARIPSFITVLISIFSAAWGISTIKEYENTKEITFYENVFRMYSFVNFSAALLLIAFIYPFMKLYVSDAFFDAWAYIPFLICSTVYASFSNFYGSLYSAIKKSVQCMYSSLISAGINVVLNYFLIIKWGIWGAVVASAIACFIATMIRIVYIRKQMGINVDRTFVYNNFLLLAITLNVSFVKPQFIGSIIIWLVFGVLNRNLILKYYDFVKHRFFLVKDNK